MSGVKLLLSAVFGPYGIRDRYAEGTGMQMELLNNQITRGQGVHSPRQSYWTFPLYLLAENVAVPSTVLDFPTWSDFTRELKRGYTHIGINFIVANVLKVKRMTEYIRSHHPEMKILLGGYGTIIPGLDGIVSYDELCRGEGVRWLREYFGEDPDRPVRHPAIHGPSYEYIYGMKTKPKGGVLLTGVGCENGCTFCITSHQFNKQYRPLLATGRDIFDACMKSKTGIGASGFTIMDENFLKKPERARELLAIMTEQNMPFVFDIFSSAEVIKQVGVDFLVRLGIRMIWIGVESKAFAHTKIKGIDLAALIEELQSNGITVNASAMLFQDHHDPATMAEDIDWVISLGSSLVQFMNYTPLPTTGLYNQLEAEGRLKGLPWQMIHGQGELAHHHPHFPDPREHHRLLRQAFAKKYKTHGPGILSMADTAIRGYETAVAGYVRRSEEGMAWNPESLRYEKCDEKRSDEFMLLRIRKMQRIARSLRPILPAAYVFAPNRAARKKALAVMRRYREVLGKPGIGERIAAAVVVASGCIEQARFWFNRMRGREGIVRQPPMMRSEYPSPSLVVRHEREKLMLLTPHFIQEIR